jgi:hypothetical protein
MHNDKQAAGLANYVLRYGSGCRDCADDGPVCTRDGLPCAERGKAIASVISALEYGFSHGYIKVPNEWLGGAALSAVPLEQNEEQVGQLSYQGNTVAFLHEKMLGYRTGIDEGWQALKNAGFPPDGNLRLGEAISRALAATSAQEPVAVVGGQPVAWVNEFSLERLAQLGPNGYVQCRLTPVQTEDNSARLYAAPADSAKQNHVAASSSLSSEPNGLSGVEKENRTLRRMLALSYAGGMLYGDDGELQDNREFPLIDFKRDTVEQIDAKMTERAMKQLIAAGIVKLAAPADSAKQNEVIYMTNLENNAAFAEMRIVVTPELLAEVAGIIESLDVSPSSARLTANWIFEVIRKLVSDSASPSAAIQGKDSDATEGVSAKEQVLAVYKRAYSLPCAGGWVIYEFGKPDVKLGTGKDESEAWEAAALKVNESAAQGRKEQ